MKRSLYIPAILLFGILIAGCKKDPVPPTLTTREVTDITYSTAISGGQITNDGGAAVTDEGVCWSTSPDPTTGDQSVSGEPGSLNFSVILTGLTEGTEYYIRAFATNKAGTSYGDELTFTTLLSTTASVTTRAVTAVTSESASSGGDIVNDGGAQITAKGICWNTSENPTTENNHTTDGTGTDGFASNLTGLEEGTTYYVRAYATNSKGTAYGNQQIFSTSASLATVTTRAITEVTYTTATSGGDISDDGGATITAKGICWNTAENPTIANNHSTDGAGTEGFASSMTGLTDGTTYYVRAYATNSQGTAYGVQQSFSTTPASPATITTRAITEITYTTARSGGDISNNGGAEITAKGICWSTSENPTITNTHTSDGTGTDGFVSDMTELLQGTTYYVRSYATNKAGTSYGNQVSFTTTIASTAILTTTAITGLTTSSGITGGNITNNGGSDVTERGVCWNTSPVPLISHNSTSDGAGNGLFVSNITGLAEGTVYYVRSYATNSAGTSYGNELSFITPMSDIEGNLYRTVAIGNQIWMAENLRTTMYNDNTAIPNVVDSLDWMAQNTFETAAYAWYRNNISNKDTYGALYNWFTVATGNLCPQGWHVPTQAEYKAMELHIGVPADSLDFWGWRGVGQGTNLKSTTGWIDGNGDNLSGFSALPAGYRAWNNGEFRGSGIITYIWTGTNDAANMKPNLAWYRRLDSPDTRIYNATTERGSGKSVRCVKNQ
jgi:uncharacterized protein (TIGR02145 family)